MPYRGANYQKTYAGKFPATNFGRQRRRMVDEQLIGRGISHPLVLQAMSYVPRHLFVQEALAAHAYDDITLPIGYGQTISQPYTVARITEFLKPDKGLRVLEIGAGCGYQMAVLAAMGCKVYGMERVREIYKTTVLRLQQLGLRNTQLHCGDGTLGFAPAAPFDRIVVSAGGPQIPPPLVRQLGDNGIMIIPVGSNQRQQRLIRLVKQHGNISTEDLGPTVFVDLIGNHGWRA